MKMNDTRFTESLFFKAFCVAVFTALAVFLLIYFKDLLKPLALGVLLWYLIKAFNGLIEKIKIRGRPLNIWVRRGIALLAILGIIQGSIAVFVSNINQIIDNYSSYQETLNTLIASLGNTFGIENITESIKSKIGDLNIQGFLRDVLASTSALLGNIFLVIVYTIFILLEENTFVRKLSLIFNSPGQADKISQLTDQIYHSTNKYVAVKAYVSALIAVLGYLVLILIGVDFAFLWALLIFALNFIPYVGSVISTLLPAVFSILQFGSPWPSLWVFGSMVVIHTVIGNYLEPKVMGKSLNLSPLVVLIALAFWGTVWDLLGMLLSVPITSIMLITFAQFPSTRGLAILLTENGDIDGLQIKD